VGSLRVRKLGGLDSSERREPSSEEISSILIAVESSRSMYMWEDLRTNFGGRVLVVGTEFCDSGRMVSHESESQGGFVMDISSGES
jgi:hypothetical protein